MTEIPKHILFHILRGYKRFISPHFGAACRYQPTCSEYAMNAVERYGAFRGSVAVAWRILRCHPFCAGGYDPVRHYDELATRTATLTE